MRNLKNLETHFAFGKNWASYSALIDEPQIEEAKKGLLKLIPAEEFKGRSFLDIGCGAALHALAAALLGVSRILAIDIDHDCVATSRAVLSNKNVAVPWRADTLTIFNLDPAREGTFDIVYSWGVCTTLAICGKRSLKLHRWLRRMDCSSLRFTVKHIWTSSGSLRNACTLILPK